jgi:hypothetical protein
VIKTILTELKRHAPFTAFGAITGIVMLGIIILADRITWFSEISPTVFYVLHPAHIILSAMVTTAIYKFHKRGFSILGGILIGYVGSVGIATLSDSIIPYLGEVILDLPNRGVHIGFIEKPWLTNPAAFLGIALAALKPTTKFPHAGHVMISTWASLFHIVMAMGQTMNLLTAAAVFLFLFAAVWFPCCLSDIIFPLLFVRASDENGPNHHHAAHFKMREKKKAF